MKFSNSCVRSDFCLILLTASFFAVICFANRFSWNISFLKFINSAENITTSDTEIIVVDKQMSLISVFYLATH